MNTASVAFGTIVGLVLALTGTGGGILAVPLLVFSQQRPIMQAVPIALIALIAVGAVGAASALGQPARASAWCATAQRP